MKIIHVLAGDSLTEVFRRANIKGETVICRECLIEGAVQSDNLDEFWLLREKFISENYGEDEENYRRNVVAEFEKLQNLDSQSEVNLWFEYELFCQTNMWFCLFLLKQTTAEVYRVQPSVRNENDVWKGFGGLDEEDLKKCFAARTKFSAADLTLGADLWEAYQNKNYVRLTELARAKSVCFPKLQEVCQAEIEKQDRPPKTLRKIIASGETNFDKIFRRFKETEGVYGFGDSQVERIYNELV